MKRTIILATILGLAGFAAGRWLLPPKPPSPSLPAQETVDAAEAIPGGQVSGAAGNPSGSGAQEAALPIRPRPTKDEVLHAADGDRLGLLLRWLAAATADEVGEMAAVFEKEQLFSRYRALWIALAGRWTDVDPEAAVVFARRLSSALLENLDENMLRGTHMQIASIDVYKTLLKLNLDGCDRQIM